MKRIPSRAISVFVLTFFVLTGVVVGLAGHKPNHEIEYHALAAAHVTVHLPPPTAAPVKVVIRAPERVSRPQSAQVVQKPPAAPAGSVRARVLAAWPGDDVWVDRTVSCESGYDPYEIGGGGNNYFGLFQMGPWARAQYGNPLNQTVEQQVASAWALIKAEGSGQWACSPYPYNP